MSEIAEKSEGLEVRVRIGKSIDARPSQMERQRIHIHSNEKLELRLGIDYLTPHHQYQFVLLVIKGRRKKEKKEGTDRRSMASSSKSTVDKRVDWL